MKLTLIGWDSRNLRCPDMSINLLVNNALPQVSLIQMPNGTGKTTTLQLLRGALNGTIEEWSPNKIRSLRRPGDLAEEGEFRVHLKIDGDQLSFFAAFDFLNGSATFRTQSPSTGGVVDGYRPPARIRRFLREEFVSLFVFDGELSEQLLKNTETRASEAIDTMAQIYLLEEASNSAEKLWQSSISDQGVKTPQGLSQQRTQLQKAEQYLKQLEQRRDSEKRKLLSASHELNEINVRIQEYIGKIENFRDEQERLREESGRLSNTITQVLSYLMELSRMPSQLHQDLNGRLLALKNNMDKLRLPETTSAQFFRELAENANCVCGREIDPLARQRILDKAADYLDADEFGLINKIKGDIEQFCTNSVDDLGEIAFFQQVESLADLDRRQREVIEELNNIKRLLIEGGDEQIQKLEARKKELELVAGDAQLVIAELEKDKHEETEKDLGRMRSIEAVSEKVEALKQKVAEISNTILLKKKIDVLNHILTQTMHRVRISSKERLIDSINQRLGQILSNEPLTIDRIDQSIHLKGQQGASVGQTLAVGYTFLMSVFESRQNQFPLVVDSPANSLDNERRREVASFIPKLCPQFVAFTISTETPGFVESIAIHARSVDYITIFRNSPANDHLKHGLPASEKVQIGGAIVVRDRDFFMSFDVLTEED